MIVTSSRVVLRINIEISSRNGEKERKKHVCYIPETLHRETSIIFYSSCRFLRGDLEGRGCFSHRYFTKDSTVCASSFTRGRIIHTCVTFGGEGRKKGSAKRLNALLSRPYMKGSEQSCLRTQDYRVYRGTRILIPHANEPRSDNARPPSLSLSPSPNPAMWNFIVLYPMGREMSVKRVGDVNYDKKKILMTNTKEEKFLIQYTFEVYTYV